MDFILSFSNASIFYFNYRFAMYSNFLKIILTSLER